MVGTVRVMRFNNTSLFQMWQSNDQEIVLNSTSADIDFSINTDDGTKVFRTDAGLGSGAGGLGFFGAAAVVQPTALTVQDTSITHTAPGTPDFAIQDLVDSGVGSAFGFATKDEGNTVLQVILNLQVRLQEAEDKLQALGLVA